MNDNDNIETDINETLYKGNVSSEIGLLYSHIFIQSNKSSKLNKMNMSIDNGDINGNYCYMNSSTWSVVNNQNPIDYTNNIDNITTNRDLKENNGLPGGVDIYDMLPASAPIKYVNMDLK